MQIFLVPALIVILLVGIGDLIKSRSQNKYSSFRSPLLSKIPILCNEVGGEYIHINSYLYVAQYYAVKSCLLRFLLLNIFWTQTEKL